MCGRMSLFTPPSVLEGRFGVSVPESLSPRYNIAPREDVAVVRNDNRDTVELLEWGLLPSWVDEPEGYSYPINARSETVADKRTFSEAFRQRRCLVLADGFYEWAETPGGKQPHRVQRTDGDPFAMAGLFERWEGNDETRETVTILTTEPNEVVEPLHHRMAVVLDEDEESTWLEDAGLTVHQDLLDPAPSAEWESYPVSTRVNDPSNDDPTIVEEINPDEQTTFGDF